VSSQAIVHSTFISFSIAVVASLVLTSLVRPLALRVGMIDQPGPRKVHAKPMPLLGGVAIYLGAALGLLVSLHHSTYAQVAGILAGATLLLIVGLLDDRGLLHPQIKLFLGAPAAALTLMSAGIKTEVFTSLLPAGLAPLANELLTILWVVGITAAFSILDHMDGLCAGVAAIASAFFMIFAIGGGQELVSNLAAAVFGAAVGFLRWNFNPARIFMGDAGAMFLGFMLATLSLKLSLTGYPPLVTCMVPVLVLGVPVFDTLLISISRARRGLIPFTSPGKDHTAHRLANLGLGQRGAVLGIYGAGVVLGILALAASHLRLTGNYLLAAVLVLGATLAVIGLERAPFERQTSANSPCVTNPDPR
jgi:UDP-GlcNAc:undecaprenyl-phosphate/decaprenyl-phosphate GlcNAc-1-phosphate transferase